MIVAIFRKNMFFNSLLLLPFAIIMRLYSIIYADNAISLQNGGYLYYKFIKILPESASFNFFLSVIIVFFEAVLINRLVIKNKFSGNITLLPGMFFIILTSIAPQSHLISPFLLGIFFLILSFLNLFKTYKKYRGGKFMFNVGLFLGVSALFCNTFALYIIPVLLGLFSIRAFKLREIIQIFVGIVLVVYFYAFSIYWNSETFTTPNFELVSIYSLFQGGIYNYIILGIFFLLILFTIFNYRSFVIKKSIQAKKKIDITFWILLFSVFILALFHSANFYQYLVVISFPLSFFTAMMLLKIKNSLISEVVVLLSIFAILIYHFQLF